MSKDIYCARCGRRLASTVRAVPSIANTVRVVEPHQCDENSEFSLETIQKVTAAQRAIEAQKLEPMPFCQFLAKEGLKSTPTVAPEDRRPKREELSTSAPENLLRAFAMGDFTNGGEMEG